MKASRTELVALSLLVGAETLGTWGNFCPSMVDTRQKGADAGFVEDLRASYRHAALTTALLAAGVSYLTRSLWPIAAWGAGAALGTANYEHALPAENRLLASSGFGVMSQ